MTECDVDAHAMEREEDGLHLTDYKVVITTNKLCDLLAELVQHLQLFLSLQLLLRELVEANSMCSDLCIQTPLSTKNPYFAKIILKI